MDKHFSHSKSTKNEHVGNNVILAQKIKRSTIAKRNECDSECRLSNLSKSKSESNKELNKVLFTHEEMLKVNDEDDDDLNTSYKIDLTKEELTNRMNHCNDFQLKEFCK